MSVAMNSWVLLAVPVLLFSYILALIWATRPDRETRELSDSPLLPADRQVEETAK